ncbi:CBS domain-containing protein [Pleionea litopenaei]|uniref:CBS domain-containing protein n=1 Tax=Pleionea litopenaei TaxID=3070815 RepID=A0AA51RT52_9GAMM|nr:CBS domain-containing protein [Pleionea sp. HL-JVS1]WMS87162.1 CBS domain-containing protein [Pleionea sp. HL-JVS1]
MYQVKDFMTAEPICLKDNNSLHKGRTTMRKYSIRHIPIIYADSGNFAGILTQKVVLSNAISIINTKGLEALEDAEKSISIESVMDTDVVTVEPETPLLDAARFFKKNRHGCIAVLDEYKVVGILTSGDFVKFAIHALDESM